MKELGAESDEDVGLRLDLYDEEEFLKCIEDDCAEKIARIERPRFAFRVSRESVPIVAVGDGWSLESVSTVEALCIAVHHFCRPGSLSEYGRCENTKKKQNDRLRGQMDHADRRQGKHSRGFPMDPTNTRSLSERACESILSAELYAKC
ncbi:hypothetical protein MRX96_001040 [Rhipicephalus microplus]